VVGLVFAVALAYELTTREVPGGGVAAADAGGVHRPTSAVA
jgi:hypothetical protein